jgi:DNA-binding MarR family transcriptional regulator
MTQFHLLTKRGEATSHLTAEGKLSDLYNKNVCIAISTAQQIIYIMKQKGFLKLEKSENGKHRISYKLTQKGLILVDSLKYIDRYIKNTGGKRNGRME